MRSQKGWKVLQNRYELVSPLKSQDAEQKSESWLGLDAFDNEFVVKLWEFDGSTANDVQRVLWDRELRTMYRVGSSPGAEKSVIIIRDAGIDNFRDCFVMVLEAHSSGYEVLGESLNYRANYAWLSNAGIDARRELWIGLRRVAQGIQLLHSQFVLHKSVSAEHILFSSEQGPSSFRLAGFEWSIRVGELHSNTPPLSWAAPPESYENPLFGYQPETDWYGFGMLATRCLLSIEKFKASNPVERHRGTLNAIALSTGRYLTDLERRFLERLIDRDHRDRLVRSYDVIAALDDLIGSLERGAATDFLQNPLILAYNPLLSNSLIEHCQEFGFVPDPKDPSQGFNPNDSIHCAHLSEFIQQDLSASQLHVGGENTFILLGRKLELKITQLEERDPSARENKIRTWDIAYCIDVADLRHSEGGSSVRDLPKGAIIVRTTNEVRKGRGDRGRAQTWERFLPYTDETDKLRASLGKFHNFIRCTNQLELLMRDAELFQYEVTSRSIAEGVERLIVREKERKRPVLELLEPEGGLEQFLHREIESGKRDCRLVVLTDPYEDAIRLLKANRIERKDCFTVEFSPKGEIVLTRACLEESTATHWNTGWLRSYGMFGQVELVRRRTEAIDRLSNHSYLLRSLSAPGQVFMDTTEDHLPLEAPADKVDDAKQSVMKDILRTRPIYALQGPPGTGKTTMVAHLLRQIFKDDPVSQVLITAQAHPAVDVLRDKVKNDAFADVQDADQPLAIRLGGDEQSDGILEGSVEDVSLKVLDGAIGSLTDRGNLTSLQKEWLEQARQIRSTIESKMTSPEAADFRQLVKRGANITYCTTSARDLEELAKSAQSFDWCIIEEAGKCHGFDLALPLQAGHRWLLIGDHNQLPPYRWEDYLKTLAELEEANEALRELPNRATGLLDFDWLLEWEQMSTRDRSSFKDFARDWLNTFRRIFEACRVAPVGSSEPRVTFSESIGAAAGMLFRQYRMHPSIGTLISESYYDGKLVNKTQFDNGDPKPNVILPIDSPPLLRGHSIVWIDTPHARQSTIARERGPSDGGARYTNQYEAKCIKSFISKIRLSKEFLGTITDEATGRPMELAVLSPYTQQVIRITRELSDLVLPPGVRAKGKLRSRVRDAAEEQRLVHTVDSFQGNEADIIIVSLVRNNLGKGPEHPLGFLREPERMNVLLSRAQRLLVLVGSWDFFSEQVETYSLEDRSRREEWHLKRVVTLLADWFRSGKAIKITAKSMLENDL